MAIAQRHLGEHLLRISPPGLSDKMQMTIGGTVSAVGDNKRLAGRPTVSDLGDVMRSVLAGGAGL